jgi:hypothetical protein
MRRERVQDKGEREPQCAHVLAAPLTCRMVSKPAIMAPPTMRSTLSCTSLFSTRPRIKNSVTSTLRSAREAEQEPGARREGEREREREVRRSGDAL